jgi:hypothetical protein
VRTESRWEMAIEKLVVWNAYFNAIFKPDFRGRERGT